MPVARGFTGATPLSIPSFRAKNKRRSVCGNLRRCIHRLGRQDLRSRKSPPDGSDSNQTPAQCLVRSCCCLGDVQTFPHQTPLVAGCCWKRTRPSRTASGKYNNLFDDFSSFKCYRILEVPSIHLSCNQSLIEWLRTKLMMLLLDQVQEHSLPIALHRVEVLLDKIAQGRTIHNEVERSARLLLDILKEDASATTVRADLNSANDRLIDLEAGLSSWRDFLMRVSRLYHSLEKGIEGIRSQLQSVQGDLVADSELPVAAEPAGLLLLTYRVNSLSYSSNTSIKIYFILYFRLIVIFNHIYYIFNMILQLIYIYY